MLLLLLWSRLICSPVSAVFSRTWFESQRRAFRGPVFLAAAAGGRFGRFLSGFLGHTPSFRRFRRVNQSGIAALVRLPESALGWASLATPGYGYKEFHAPPHCSLNALPGRNDEQQEHSRYGGNAGAGSFASRGRLRSRRRSILRRAPVSRGNGKEYVAPGLQSGFDRRGGQPAAAAMGRRRLGSGSGRGGGPSGAPAVVAFQFGLPSLR